MRRGPCIIISENQDSFRIGRRTNPVIEVEHAPTLASLKQIVADAGGIDRVLISDLSLGAWRPHQIAAEWAEACGLTPYPPSWEDARSSVRAQLNFSDVADAGIEAEALGERVVRDALVLSERLMVHLSHSVAPSLLAVIAPAEGRPWREENLVFLRFVIAALENTCCRVRLLVSLLRDADRSQDVGFNAPAGLLVQWHSVPLPASLRDRPAPVGIAYLPGLIPKSIARAIESNAAGLQLRTGVILPAPELRPAGPVAPTAYDRLRPALSEHLWLDAFAQFAGSNYHVDASSLGRNATSAFDLGSTEIAMDYLQRAINCSRGTQRAGLQCQLQGYRIATHRFSEAAKAEEPSPNLPPKLAAFLSMARGWGAVMSGQTERGIADLRRSADRLSGDLDEKFHAYLRNITALGLAQLGSFDQAMAYEQAVDRQNAGPARSWPLYYVNQINIARLHRRLGDHRAARRYYGRAFASHWGGRSASDRVYVNAVMARLAEAEQKPALIHWVRSALHFAAAVAPESFDARRAGIVVGARALQGSREERVETVAEALAAKIEVAVPFEAGVGENGSLPVFTECAPDPDRGATTQLIGAPGWSLVADLHPIPIAFNGAAMRRLRRALVFWITHTCGLDLRWVQTFHVDSRLGREMAASGVEFLETALRLNISKILSTGFTVFLDSERQQDLTDECRLQLSQLVSTVEHRGNVMSVRFKRCRRPFQFTDCMAAMAAAERGERVGNLVARRPPGLSRAQAYAEISRLEQGGVVWRNLPSGCLASVIKVERGLKQ